ncbi:hypothetical protein J3458_004533 [Metarhizium acridum]|uniref:uncharacterized protein n=1 Tax=Metarhizium acridum TaxID=92637 RepID=UPI001C6AC933|nr:hypothetical protein J3458_004533 [Metarhizium acridum]
MMLILFNASQLHGPFHFVVARVVLKKSCELCDKRIQGKARESVVENEKVTEGDRLSGAVEGVQDVDKEGATLNHTTMMPCVYLHQQDSMGEPCCRTGWDSENGK